MRNDPVLTMLRRSVTLMPMQNVIPRHFSRAVSLFAVLFTGMMMTACAGDVCAPGTTNICLCPGGETGAQSCKDDGSGYDPCQCGDAPADAGPAEDAEAPDATPEADAEPPVVDSGADALICEPRDFKDCKEDTDEVWWFDSCGRFDELVETCEEGQCQGAECTGDTCTADVAKGCSGNAIHWFDSCGDIGSFVSQCPDGTSCYCPGGSDTCPEPDCSQSCNPHEYTACHEGHVWFFDSCDQPESVSDGCEDTEFCTNDACVKPYYDGTWHVTSDDQKPGVGSFVPLFVAMTVDGTDITASTSVLGITIDYTGTLAGKAFTLFASYTYGSETHDESWQCTFESATTFTGLLADSISIEGLGDFGQVVWNITGDKQ